MIKKTLLTAGLVLLAGTILAGVIIFGIQALTPVSAWPAEKNRVEYIENSFNSFKDKFFEEAKFNFVPGIVAYYYLMDETEPKTTSYYLMVYGSPGRISMISAHKEVKLSTDVVEMWKEIIYIVEPGTPFQHSVSHTTMDQNDNCLEKNVEPLVEVWDEVVDKLIFNKEDRVQYIKNSFYTFGEHFFLMAEKLREGSDVHYYFKKETNPRTISYYLTVTTNAYIPMYIISINARKEIEIGDGLVEWYEEGISLDQETNKYSHTISHMIMNRKDNCELTKFDNAKVWDNVIENLFQ